MFLLESSHIKSWKWFLRFFEFLTMFEFIIQVYNFKWVSIAFLILFIYYHRLLKTVKKIENIQNRFEFIDVFVEHKGIKNKTKYVSLIDKDKEGKNSLIIKDEMDYSFRRLYKSQEKRLKFTTEVTFKKDEMNELLAKEGFDEI